MAKNGNDTYPAFHHNTYPPKRKKKQKTTILFIALLLVRPRTSLQIEFNFYSSIFFAFAPFCEANDITLRTCRNLVFFHHKSLLSLYYYIHVRFKIESFESMAAGKDASIAKRFIYKVIVSILDWLAKNDLKNSKVTNDFVFVICNEFLHWRGLGMFLMK